MVVSKMPTNPVDFEHYQEILRNFFALPHFLIATKKLFSDFSICL